MGPLPVAAQTEGRSMAMTDQTNSGPDQRTADRRGTDRRAAQEPIDFADRRTGERRSATDRRQA